MGTDAGGWTGRGPPNDEGRGANGDIGDPAPGATGGRAKGVGIAPDTCAGRAGTPAGAAGLVEGRGG